MGRSRRLQCAIMQVVLCIFAPQSMGKASSRVVQGTTMCGSLGSRIVSVSSVSNLVRIFKRKSHSEMALVCELIPNKGES